MLLQLNSIADQGAVITDMLPMNGRRASGITTLPSACWKFSKMATIMRGTAQAVAFRVCTNSVGTFFVFCLLPLLAAASASSVAFGLYGTQIYT